MSYSLWGCKELDVTEQLTHTHTQEAARETNESFRWYHTDITLNRTDCVFQKFSSLLHFSFSEFRLF